MFFDYTWPKQVMLILEVSEINNDRQSEELIMTCAQYVLHLYRRLSYVLFENR